MPFKPPLLLGFKRILACGWKIASNLFIDKHLIHDYTLENGLDKQVTFVDDQETALHQLAQGRHDCALVSRVAALSLIEKNGWTNLELGKKPILAGEYGYAVAKGQKALLSQLRIPDENSQRSGGKMATIPMGKRPAFRLECGHHSGENGQYKLRV